MKIITICGSMKYKKEIKYAKKLTKNIIFKNKTDLEELFKEYNGNNLAKDFEWDNPVGKEIW